MNNTSYSLVLSPPASVGEPGLLTLLSGTYERKGSRNVIRAVGVEQIEQIQDGREALIARAISAQQWLKGKGALPKDPFTQDQRARIVVDGTFWSSAWTAIAPSALGVHSVYSVNHAGRVPIQGREIAVGRTYLIDRAVDLINLVNRVNLPHRDDAVGIVSWDRVKSAMVEVQRKPRHSGAEDELLGVDTTTEERLFLSVAIGLRELADVLDARLTYWDRSINEIEKITPTVKNHFRWGCV